MKKLRLAALTSLVAMAATSAFASNEMYVLGGVAIDNNDIGGEFTFGSQIVQSNWYIESTLLVISTDYKYSQSYDDTWRRTGEEFDSLIVSLAPMYKHSFSENFSIYGKAGALYTYSKTKLVFSCNNSYDVHKGIHMLIVR